MKQTIKMTMLFPDRAFKFKIKKAYKIANQLIVISNIKCSKEGGDGLTHIRSDSLTVTVNSKQKLAIKHYVLTSDNLKNGKQFYFTKSGEKLTVVKTLKNIPELKETNLFKILNKVKRSWRLAMQRIFPMVIPNNCHPTHPCHPAHPCYPEQLCHPERSEGSPHVEQQKFYQKEK